MKLDRDDRRPSSQHGATAQPPGLQNSSSYAHLLAEADELLQLVQNLRPAQQHFGEPVVLSEVKMKSSAETNQLAVVRVTVWPSLKLFQVTVLVGVKFEVVLLGVLGGRADLRRSCSARR